MAREARISCPGMIHHVMAHAIDDMPLFRDDLDRRVFTNLFSQGLQRTGFQCYSWDLMDNHYHFSVRTNDKHLSELMRPLNSCYARYYNGRHGRRGYLFRDRYRSMLCSDQQYALDLIRYIHLNPLRAGICSSMEELRVWPWSGHAALMGTIPNEFQDIEAVLKCFGNTQPSARAAYEAFVQRGVELDDDDEIARAIGLSHRRLGSDGEPACWVIGDQKFVMEAIRRDRENRRRLSRIKRAGWTLEDLAGFVARSLSLDRHRMRWPARCGPYARARCAMAALGYLQMGVPQTKLARYLGVAPATVSAMVKRSHELVSEFDIDSALSAD